MKEEYNICGYCGKQFSVNPRFLPHGKGYCGSYCQNADEISPKTDAEIALERKDKLIEQSARAMELFSEDELEKFAGDFEPSEY